jgi:hypothetical protein
MDGIIPHRWSIWCWSVPLMWMAADYISNHMIWVSEPASIILESTTISSISPPEAPRRSIAVTVILNVQQKVIPLGPQCRVILCSIDWKSFQIMLAAIMSESQSFYHAIYTRPDQPWKKNTITEQMVRFQSYANGNYAAICWVACVTYAPFINSIVESKKASSCFLICHDFCQMT